MENNQISLPKATFAVTLIGLLMVIIVQVSNFSTTFGELRSTVSHLARQFDELTKMVHEQAVKHEEQTQRYQERQLEQDRRIRNLENKLGGL